MKYTCNYCSAKLSRKNALTRHQKINKRCLLKQNKESKIFSCDGCGKYYKSNQTLTNHHPCGILYEKKYNELKEEFLDLKKQLHEKTTTMRDLGARIMQYDDDKKIRLEELENAAKERFKFLENSVDCRLEKFENNTIEQSNRPTYTNINKNKYDITVLNLDADRIENIVMNNYDVNYLRRGVKGVVQFLDKYILRDEHDQLLYFCVDKSRKKFKYKTLEGITEDIRCNKLLNVTHPPIVDKSQILLNKQDDDVDIYEEIVCDIKNIKKNNRFYSEMIKLSN